MDLICSYRSIQKGDILYLFFEFLHGHSITHVYILQEMCDLLFYSSFYGLAWNDTHTANKCTCVAGLIYENVTFSI